MLRLICHRCLSTNRRERYERRAAHVPQVFRIQGLWPNPSANRGAQARTATKCPAYPSGQQMKAPRAVMRPSSAAARTLTSAMLATESAQTVAASSNDSAE